jgi:hypothetical protein
MNRNSISPVLRILLIAIVTLAIGVTVFLWTWHGMLVRIDNRVDTTDATDRLRRHVQQFARANQSLAAAIDAMRQTSVPNPSSSDDTVKEPVAWSGGSMAVLSELGGDPKTVGLALAHFRASTRDHYGALFAILRLTADERERALQVMVEHAAARFDIANEGMRGEKVETLHSGNDTAFEQKLADVISPERAHLIAQAEQQFSPWLEVQQFLDRVVYEADGLNQAQLQRLMTDWEPMAADVAMRKKMTDAEAEAAMISRNETLLQKSAEYLTPGQHAALVHHTENALQTLKTFLPIMRSLHGAPPKRP